MKTINFWQRFTVTLDLVAFIPILKVLYQIPTNKVYFELCFTKMLHYPSIMNIQIGKRKFILKHHNCFVKFVQIFVNH